MNLQAEAAETLKASSVGRLIYKNLRPVVHAVHRTLHPDVPPELKRVKVPAYDRETSFIQRRTFADFTVIKQCFHDRQYDFPTGAHGAFLQDRYEQIVASGRQPLIVDCGANIGASVVWFNTRYPRAHIVAIEPASDNFAVLRRNCTNLDVDVRQAGIAAEDGFGHLTDTDGSSLAYRTIAGGPGDDISMLSISTLCASKPSTSYVPFLLKIDIEGAERNLFDGDVSAINEFPIIIMEPHDWLLPGQLTSASFMRYHAASGREFVVHHENVASIACHPS
jgi:FkbM family methyltransferase